MILRRHLIMGAACVASAAAAEGLKPHRQAQLLQGAKLADVAPRKFGSWTSEDVADALALNAPGTLGAELYNEVVARDYQNAAGAVVSILLAYGARQTDTLQLHRPEICFPAFGYSLSRIESVNLPIARGLTLPARRMAAQRAEQRESVIYWSRLGEFFPQSADQQKMARIKTTLKGVVADGVLARFSTANVYPEFGWTILSGFIDEFLAATAAPQRKALIGTERADAWPA
jgi:EpsI family protein